MKVLIIGGGAVSEIQHIPAAIALLGKENVLVAETNAMQRSKLADTFKLPNLTTDYKQELKNIDFVLLATPPHLHADIIEDCLNKGIPVLCEKPLSRSFDEIAETLKLSHEKKIQVALCHLYRFFPNRNYIRTLLHEGYFGDKLIIDIQEGDPADWPTVTGYNFRKELVPGGVLFDGGIHSLDFILWCLGKPLTIEYIDDSLGGLESNAVMHFTFENNAKATFRISRTCSLPNKISIKGSLNSASFGIFEMNKIDFISGEQTHKADMQNIEYSWSNIARYQMEDFIEAVKNKAAPKCTFDEGADVIKVIEECYKMKKKRALPEKAPFPGFMF